MTVVPITLVLVTTTRLWEVSSACLFSTSGSPNTGTNPIFIPFSPSIFFSSTDASDRRLARLLCLLDLPRRRGERSEMGCDILVGMSPGVMKNCVRWWII